ncbi:MAG: hypothetical protein ACLSD6_03070 [Clostridium sp.]
MYNILHIMIQCFIRSNGGDSDDYEQGKQSIKTTTAKTAAKPAVKPVAKPAVKTTAAPAKEEPKKKQ